MGRKSKLKRRRAAARKQAQDRRQRAAPLPATAPAARGVLGVLVLVPALLAGLIFANILQNDFVYDDEVRIQRLPDTMPPVARILRPRGLTLATQVLDKQLSGTDPYGFHATNLMLHALASGLAAWAAFSLSRSRRVALATGLMFAVHPVHVEAVASFVNRKDVLAMIFACLALILWRSPRHPSWCWAGALFCYGLGILAKEVAILALAPMLFLADLLPAGGQPGTSPERLRRAAWRILPLLVSGAVLVLWAMRFGTRRFKPQVISSVTEQQLHSYGEVLANSAAAVVDHFRLLFLPWNLAADYPLSPGLSLTDSRAVLGLTLVLLWVAFARALWSPMPLAAWAMLWTVVMYLPVSNIVPLTIHFVAERYLYVPSFGVCLLFGLAVRWGLEWADREPSPRLRAAVAGLALAVVALGGLRSVARNRDWRDPETFWTAELRAGHGTWRGYANLGSALADQGRNREAIPYFRQAKSIWPTSTNIRQRLVQSLIKSGDVDRALVECQELLDKNRRGVHCGAAPHYWLGTALAERADHDRAVVHFQRSLDIEPWHRVVQQSLIDSLVALDRLDEAAAACRPILDVEPADARCARIQQMRQDRAQAVE